MALEDVMKRLSLPTSLSLANSPNSQHRAPIPSPSSAVPTPTDPGEILIPGRPHLDDEEGRPANDVGRHDHEGHFHGADLGAGNGLHAADTPCVQDSSVQGAFARALAPRCLSADVAPDVVADETVAGAQDDHRRHEHAAGHPGHVGRETPGLDEVGPAVVGLGDVAHLDHGEDEVLRGAQHETQHPSGGDHEARAARGLLQRLQRVAHGDVAIGSHDHQHVGRGEHGEHLHVLHHAAQPVGSAETVGDVPAQLGQHLEEGDGQVGQAEVADEEVHAGRLARRAVQRQQHAAVTQHGHHENHGQHGNLQLGQLLVARVRLRAAVFPERLRVLAGVGTSGSQRPPPAGVARGPRAGAPGESHAVHAAPPRSPLRPVPFPPPCAVRSLLASAHRQPGSAPSLAGVSGRRVPPANSAALGRVARLFPCSALSQLQRSLEGALPISECPGLQTQIINTEFVSPDRAPSRPSGWRLLGAYSRYLPLLSPRDFPFSQLPTSVICPFCITAAGVGLESADSSAYRLMVMLPRSSINLKKRKKLGELDVSYLFRASHHFLRPPSRITLTLTVTSIDAVPRNPESTARSGALEPEFGA